jgi:hypothetical protein
MKRCRSGLICTAKAAAAALVVVFGVAVLAHAGGSKGAGAFVKATSPHAESAVAPAAELAAAASKPHVEGLPRGAATGLCAGFCGDQSPSGCFCDEACFYYGDCCPGVCGDCPNLAFCTPDNCADAIAIGDGSFSFSTVGATTDGPPACGSLGNDIWYRYAATCSGAVTVSLCGSSYDTVLAIYGADCPSGDPIVCNDDFCGLSSQVTFAAIQGVQYLIRIGGFAGSTGTGIGEISCVPAAPPNDDCINAVTLSCNQSVDGTTINANPDPGATTCVTSVGAPGVWYRIFGTGGIIVLDTCSSVTNYDTKISVYTNGCGTLTCVTGNDDWGGCDVNTLHSRVEFNSNNGQEYLVLVHGFSGQTGNFRLNVNCLGSGSVDCACNGEYSVGDRVRLLVNNPDGNEQLLAGHLGTVVCGTTAFGGLIFVSWDGITNGHAGNGFCECPTAQLPPGSTTGWWVECGQIEPVTGCVGDLNNSGAVDVFDLLILLGAWGPCPGCPADLNASGAVDVFDLLILLGAWGPCPSDGCNPGDCAGSFPACGSGPECVCFEAFRGGGVCAIGPTPCGDPCPTGFCPPGFVCITNTCCGFANCIPVSALCDTSLEGAPQAQPGELTNAGYADGPGAVKPEIKK